MAQLVMTSVVVAVSKEINDVEMGVLDDGTPFLTGRSLAKLCGVAPSTVIGQAAAWKAGLRNGKLAMMLEAAGYDGLDLYIKTTHKGREVHAYTDSVCMVFLEYYAFEAATSGAMASIARAQATKNFRLLARAGFRGFVYTALGYDPQNQVPPIWRQFHDRLAVHAVPAGFFSVFREMADFVLFSIQQGFKLDARNVPDISVGKCWSTYWRDHNLQQKFGDRKKHDHNFPDYFPQAASNPQEMWVYPVEALGAFRVWLQNEYIPGQFPKYLQSKVSQGSLPASVAELLLNAVAGDDEDKAPGLPPLT